MLVAVDEDRARSILKAKLRVAGQDGPLLDGLHAVISGMLYFDRGDSFVSDHPDTERRVRVPPPAITLVRGVTETCLDFCRHKLLSFNFGFLCLCVLFCVVRAVFYLTKTDTDTSYRLFYW